jgi:hypothetical protein
MMDLTVETMIEFTAYNRPRRLPSIVTIGLALNQAAAYRRCLGSPDLDPTPEGTGSGGRGRWSRAAPSSYRPRGRQYGAAQERTV